MLRSSVSCGGLEVFSFRCPCGCSMTYHIGGRPWRPLFDHASQRFQCPCCYVELQLSILVS